MLKSLVDVWKSPFGPGALPPAARCALLAAARCVRDMVVDLVTQVSLPPDRDEFEKKCFELYDGRFDIETRAQMLLTFHMTNGTRGAGHGTRPSFRPART